MIQAMAAVAAVAISVALVDVFPRSILVFLAFQLSLLYVWVARIPEIGSTRLNSSHFVPSRMPSSA